MFWPETDQLNAVLAAVGFNVSLLLRRFARIWRALIQLLFTGAEIAAAA
ncbi:hypothetical protein [Aurantimonas sp. VKM B-3413]|nr:hypothetical protein [Aurantimonas sp. VKM B-3413]MCB8837465.1 hypothetical protein [Aurantimonas sp. VKM B-3413]